MKQEIDSRVMHLFYLFCNTGNVEGIKSLLSDSETIEQLKNTKLVSCPLTLACNIGHLEIVKYLVLSTELQSIFKVPYKIDNGLKLACKNGHYDIVEFLLTHQELKGYATIHGCNTDFLKNALYNNHWNIATFLISDNRLDKKSSPDLLFIGACRDGHLEIVKFLTSEKFKNFIDIYINNDAALRSCIVNNCIEITDYLINEYKIIVHPNVEKMLSIYTNESSKIITNKLLEHRLKYNSMDNFKKAKI